MPEDMNLEVAHKLTEREQPVGGNGAGKRALRSWGF